MRRIASGLFVGILTVIAVVLANRPNAAPPTGVELIAVRLAH